MGLFHSVFHLDWYRCGLLISVDSGMPFSSAASIVNSLNVEPAWYPGRSPPPSSGFTVAG